MGNHYMFI